MAKAKSEIRTAAAFFNLLSPPLRPRVLTPFLLAFVFNVCAEAGYEK